MVICDVWDVQFTVASAVFYTLSTIFPAHETLLSEVILEDSDRGRKEGSITGSGSGENDEVKTEIEKGYRGDVTVGMARV